MQVGGTGVDLPAFQEYIDDAMADPLAHFVGVGDYCVTIDTPVLTSDLRWVAAGSLVPGDKVVGFDEDKPAPGKRRRFKVATIETAGRNWLHVWRLHLSDGTVLNSTDEHRWLARCGGKAEHEWIRTDEIVRRHQQGLVPVSVARFFEVHRAKHTEASGYLAAAFDGEGFFGALTNGGVRLSMAQKDNAMLGRVADLLKKAGYSFDITPRNADDVLELRLSGGRKTMMRFLMENQPVRLLDKWQNKLINGMVTQAMTAPTVVRVEDLGVQEIAAISSDSKTYIADGFGAHNTDGVSPSNRRLLRGAFVKGELYDTADKMMEGAAERDVMTFLDIVKPTRGKWDFLLEGHHFWERPDLRTSDQGIADYLGCPNLGRGEALITYQFRAGPPLVMFALHGGGGGDSFAAPLNRLEKQMRAWTAHIYLTGHHHKVTAARAVKLDRAPESTTQLSATDSVLVAAGSWMHGFVEGTVSYAEAGQMVPLAVGAPVIQATRRKNGTFKVRVTL